MTLRAGRRVQLPGGDNLSVPPIAVTTTWQQHVVYFNQLAQQGFGVPRETAIAAAAIYGAHFQII